MKPYGIENDRQYEITRGRVAQFEAALAETAGDGPPENENGRTAWELGRAGMGGILNTLGTLRAQMREYGSRRGECAGSGAPALRQTADAGRSSLA